MFPEETYFDKGISTDPEEGFPFTMYSTLITFSVKFPDANVSLFKLPCPAMISEAP